MKTYLRRVSASGRRKIEKLVATGYRPKRWQSRQIKASETVTFATEADYSP